MTDIVEIQLVEQGPAGPAGLYPQANWDAGQVPYARSTVLAHNGGVWLALRDTSVEPSVSVPSDWASWLDFSGLSSGFATLDGSGKIPAAQLPAIAITDTYAVASQAAMLALAAQKGDIAIRSDLNKSFVLAADDPTVLANWKELLTPTDAVLSVAGRTGAVTLAQADISGLTTASSPQFAGLQFSTDVLLVRDAANTLALRNGTNPQALNVYGTYTNASNYEQVALYYHSGLGRYLLSVQPAGTGTGRNLMFNNNGGAIEFAHSGTVHWSTPTSGHLLAGADNSYDIGASGATRPRVGYFGTRVETVNLKATGAQIDLTGLPTTDPHVAGRLWANSGVLTVSAG